MSTSALQALGRDQEALEVARYLRMRMHWPDYKPYDDRLKEIG